MAHSHTVVEGDTLSQLAQHFYGDAGLFSLIAHGNGIEAPYKIAVGQILTIPDLPAYPRDPAIAQTHVVVDGDTLWALAVRFYGDGRLFPLIAQTNRLSNPDLIHAGQVLTIPPQPAPNVRPSA